MYNAEANKEVEQVAQHNEVQWSMEYIRIRWCTVQPHSIYVYIYDYEYVQIMSECDNCLVSSYCNNQQPDLV